MKHFAVVFLCLIAIISCRSNATNGHQVVGGGDLLQVMNSYPDSYNHDQQRFWDVLNKSRRSAITCSSEKVAKDFLSLVDTKNLGADLEEFISEGIEMLCVKNSSCFHRAMSSLDLETQSKISVRLSNPIFFDVGEMACMKEKNR